MRRVGLVVATLLLAAVPVGLGPQAAGHSEPVPIKGGIKIPGGPFIHTFAPGPVGLNPFTQGLRVEPSTITNFRGFTAMAYITGTAKDSKGKVYKLEADMRAMKGEFQAADGHRFNGTFVFI